MIAEAVFVLAVAAAAAGAIVALRARASAAGTRLALRLALAREAALLAAARALADAARRSLDDVRAELGRALHGVAPAVDAVAAFEERDGALACVATSGERLEHYRGARIARDDPQALIARALRAGHRVTLESEAGAVPLHPGDVAALAVPVDLEAGRTATIYVASRERLDPATIERVAALLDVAAPAYRTATERESDRRRAEYDGLTGLLTPAAFRRELATLVDRTRVRRGRLALVFVDTDRFKAWNDTYGHASGDVLLRTLAATLRAATAGDDLAGRNGGDEFCLALADCEKSTAVERAEELRAAIAAMDFAALRPAGAAADVTVSASIGVAAFPVDATSPAALLERADAAMYHAKHAGRNAVAFLGVDGALSVALRREPPAERSAVPT